MLNVLSDVYRKGWPAVSSTSQDLTQSLKKLFCVEKNDSETKRVSKSEPIYWPDETCIYQLDTTRSSEKWISFKHNHLSALFDCIEFYQEGGKIAITVRSEYTDEMHNVLDRNNIPTKDCEFSKLNKGLTHFQVYNTSNPIACSELAKILFEKNQFQCDEGGKGIVENFIEVLNSVPLEESTSASISTDTFSSTHSTQASDSAAISRLRFRKITPVTME